MSTGSFRDYAEYYDLIYKDKDYEGELEFIESFFGDNKPSKILELGCGTGNYTKILSEKGYDVTAIDLSEDMLEIARRKCSCRVIQGDIRDFSIDEKFDAAICMFAVLGYITDNRELKKTLVNIRAHLKPGGLFIFDVWNGLAVLRMLPEERVKEIEDGDIEITRVAVPTLRSFHHITEVDYKLNIKRKRDNKVHEVTEKHVVRFFFPQEIVHFLENAGFEVEKICPFMDAVGELDENAWNMTVVAKAKGGKQ